MAGNVAATRRWQNSLRQRGFCIRGPHLNDRWPKRLCSKCQVKHSVAGHRSNPKRDRPTLKELRPLRQLRKKTAHLVVQLDRWGVPMPAGLASTLAEVRTLAGGEP